MKNRFNAIVPDASRRVYEQIIDVITEMVASGELGPGDKLPPERHLTDLLDVSRSSLREAIRALQEQGVLESRRGAGTYVSETACMDVVSPFTELLMHERVRLWHLFQFRHALEPQIAKIAANNAQPKHLEAMQRLLSSQKAAIGSSVSVVNSDHNFHQLIAIATGNPLFLDVITQARNRLAETSQQELQGPERKMASYDYHRRIYDAIATGRPVRAEQLMREHLEQVEAMLFTVQHY